MLESEVTFVEPRLSVWLYRVIGLPVAVPFTIF